MKLYRLSFRTDMLVQAGDARSAIDLGRRYLRDEVNNGLSELVGVEEVRRIEQLRGNEGDSLPWRDPARDNEREVMVADILSTTGER